MGLSFHYSGKIKDATLIPHLVEEVEDISVALQWEHYLIDDEEIRGIVFSPPECEPVFLSFNDKNELCSPVLLKYEIIPATTISVKTQYAGIEVHKALIKLFKHLEKPYFKEFELNDEGGYWNTLDEDTLIQQFDKYNFLLQAVRDHLKDFKSDKNDTAESLAEKLEQFLKKRLGGE
jgi:hypothetical protein